MQCFQLDFWRRRQFDWNVRIVPALKRAEGVHLRLFVHAKVLRLREIVEEGLKMLWSHPHLPQIAIHTNIHAVVERNVV